MWGKKKASLDDLRRELLALEELRRAYDAIGDSSDILDRKAGELLGAGSLITGLFAALQIRLIEEGQSPLYWMGVALVFLGFLSLIVLCTGAFRARERVYKLPIRPEWNTVVVNVLMKTPKEAVLKMIRSYTEYIPYNQELNTRKDKRVRAASFLLAGIVAVLLVLSVFPR